MGHLDPRLLLPSAVVGVGVFGLVLGEKGGKWGMKSEREEWEQD